MQSTNIPARLLCGLLVLSVLCVNPALLAQDPSEGWEQQAEGYFTRDSERSVEYLALGSDGMAAIAPLIEERLALAEAGYQAQPTEDGERLVAAWASTLDQVHQLAASGTAANTACTQGADYGGLSTTLALSCGNHASAYPYANNNGNCLGPFYLYAFSQVERDCGQQTNIRTKLRSLAPGWGTANSSTVLFGPYSTCGSYAAAWAISNPDNVLYLNEDTGSGTGCSSNPRSCPLCAVIDDGTE